MGATERVPDVLPINVSYFDHDAFRDWVHEHLGDRGEHYQAAALGIRRRFLRKLKAGDCSPAFETYMRMIAVAAVPLGTWVRFSDQGTQRT